MLVWSPKKSRLNFYNHILQQGDFGGEEVRIARNIQTWRNGVKGLPKRLFSCVVGGSGLDDPVPKEWLPQETAIVGVVSLILSIHLHAQG